MVWDGLGWNRNPSQGGMVGEGILPKVGWDGWRRNPSQGGMGWMEKESSTGDVGWAGGLLACAAAQGKKKPQYRRISSELSAQSPAGRMGALHPC